MRSSGIEDLKAVLRRSALLIVAIVLIGVVVMNVIRQVGGPSYDASARVLLNTSDLSSAALGISQPYQDPTRVDQAEQNLVDSPDLYTYAARRAGGGPIVASELMNSVSGTVSNNVVDFQGTAGRAHNRRPRRKRSRHRLPAVASSGEGTCDRLGDRPDPQP